jgi:hypothetical protein
VDVNLKALLEEPLRYSADLLRHLPPALPQLQAYTAEAKLPPPPGPAQAAQPSPAPVPTGPPPPPPPDLVGPVKVQVNRSAEDLCHSLHGLRDKYPFNERAPQEASIQDLNAVFAPVTGSLAQFVHTLDVSRVYELKGREWVPNPAFPATFSQPFLGTLNSLQQFSDELYPDEATSPHFEYSLELNGTGKMPFELDEDAHILTYNPKKGGGSVRLPWPPVTGAGTKLMLEKHHLAFPQQSNGLWSLFRLLQAADDQSGTLFTFRTQQFDSGHKHVPIVDGKGNPVTLQIRLDPPQVANMLSPGYFSKMHCEGWVVH